MEFKSKELRELFWDNAEGDSGGWDQHPALVHKTPQFLTGPYQKDGQWLSRGMQVRFFPQTEIKKSLHACL